MRTTLISIAALLGGAFFMLVGNGLTNTLIPVRAHVADFSAYSIGAIGAAQFFGFVIGCLICPFAVRRAGHIRAFAAFAAIAACSVLLLPMALHPVPWAILRAITGLCFAGLFMVIESWLNERASNEYRGRVFSVYQAVVLIGALGGQQLLALGAVESFELFSIAAIMIALALIPISMTATLAPTPLQNVKPRIRWLISTSPIGAIGCSLVGIANGALWGLAPIFAQQRGLDVTHIGWFMSAIIGGGALTQWPIGKISDHFDRRAVILTVAALSSLAGVSFVMIGDSTLIILLLQAACYGGLAMTLYSLCIAHVNDLVEPEDFIHVSSGMLLLFGLGAVIGPMIASALMEAVGFEGLFLFTAVAHAAIAVLCIVRLVMRPRSIIDEREPFVVSMPRTAPVVSSLDPRAEIDESDIS